MDAQFAVPGMGTAALKMPDINQEIRSILQRWQCADHIRLHAGEMSAQEMRSVRAVLRAVISCVVLAWSVCAHAQPLRVEIVEDTSWHLFTQSEGGTINLLHGLTKKVCEFAMNRALRRPATDDEKAAAAERERLMLQASKKRFDECMAKKPPAGETVCNMSSSGMVIVGGYGSPGTITRAECFQ